MSTRRGFTLVELLIVITILGVLGSIGFVSFRGIQERARDTARKTDLRQLGVALEIYRQSNSGKYITTASAYCDSINSDKFYTDIAQYMSGSVPNDPSTDNRYCYYSEGTNGASFRLFAKLENCSDPDINVQCQNYNFSVPSADLTFACDPGDPPLSC